MASGSAQLWVDDLREPPDGSWAVARTSAAAIALLAAARFDVLSLDHDLGGDDTTRAVVLWLCEHPEDWPGDVRVHSANPVGRTWLIGMIERYRPG